jgi:hypothetical protein
MTCNLSSFGVVPDSLSANFPRVRVRVRNCVTGDSEILS